MRAPFFWYQPRGLLSACLYPLGWLYGIGIKFVLSFAKTQRFSVPVISIGGIVCGGSGKTPTAIALARLLQKRGHVVHFVTRGYKGQESGPLEVNPSLHSPIDVGDEPLLLARYAPTWVAKKRGLGIQKAIEKGAQLIILDDGHQTKGIYKSVSFVVMDVLQGFGNKCIIPAGPLRESLSEGLRRADAFIGIGGGEASMSRPFFKAQSILRPLTLPSHRVIAFCGLGFPQKFYRALKDIGLDLIAVETFPDHYVYNVQDLARLQNLAKSHRAILVTTRKDFVKVPASWQARLHVLDIEIQFEDNEEIYQFMLEKIPSLREAA